MRKILALIAALAIAACANAQTISGGIGQHTHVSATQGGTSLLPASIIVTSSGNNNPATFTNSTGDTIIKSVGGNGYGSALLEGSAANGSHLFFFTGGAEIARVSGVSGGSMILATGAGTTTALTLTGGNSTVAGTLASTKACAANFTRMTPNYCSRVDVISTASVPGACAAVTLPDSAAKVLIIHVAISILTNSAIGNRDITGRWWGDGACAVSQVAIATHAAREEVAVAAQILGVSTQTLTVPVVSGALFASSAISGAGAGSSIAFQIRGYYD